jgi:hypothetical protein
MAPLETGDESFRRVSYDISEVRLNGCMHEGKSDTIKRYRRNRVEKELPGSYGWDDTRLGRGKIQKPDYFPPFSLSFFAASLAQMK